MQQVLQSDPVFIILHFGSRCGVLYHSSLQCGKSCRLPTNSLATVINFSATVFYNKTTIVHAPIHTLPGVAQPCALRRPWLRLLYTSRTIQYTTTAAARVAPKRTPMSPEWRGWHAYSRSRGGKVNGDLRVRRKVTSNVCASRIHKARNTRGSACLLFLMSAPNNFSVGAKQEQIIKTGNEQSQTHYKYEHPRTCATKSFHCRCT